MVFRTVNLSRRWKEPKKNNDPGGRQAMKNKRQNEKKKNQGFSLITVIVAVSFVGILGMLVLYISMANLNMKVTDLKGKDSFYTAEQALEEIRTGLQQDVGDAMSEAFIAVMEDYDTDVGNSDISQESLRQDDFQEKFVNKIRALMGVVQVQGGDHYSMDHLRSYVDESRISEDEVLIVTNPSGKEPLWIRDGYGILLKDIKVIYVDEKGRASIIVTDICLGIPKPEFPNAATLPDLMNFSLIADGGIVVNNSKEDPAVISGSAYVGRIADQQNYLIGTKNEKERASIWLGAGSALEIDSGERLVSEGDILVNVNGKFGFTSGRELWAQGITVASAEVSLSGTIYLSDDLTVERGNGGSSQVNVSGSYYGYGSAASARESLNYKAQDGQQDERKDAYRLYKNESDADISSSIIINGKNATMDLSGIQKLMLAGRSYIASSDISIQSGRPNLDVMTGESLTVKGAQIVYLAPPEILGAENDTETLNNPMTYGSYLEYLSNHGNLAEMPVKSNAPVAAWGGRTLKDITGYDEESKQIQTVFYNDNTTGENGFVYFYLNFDSEQRAASFMSEYYANNETVRNNLDKYLSFYFDPNSGIQTNPNTYLRYVTNGNVLTYDGKEKKGDITEATNADSTAEAMVQEQISLQNTWYALNRKMLTSVNLLNENVEDKKTTNLEKHNEKDPSRSVFENIVNEREIAGFVNGDSSKQKEFENNGKKALVCHNANGSLTTYDDVSVSGSNQTLKVDKDCPYSLIVCTGDVEITAGTEFHGIIIAKGKITLKGNAKLISSSQDASAVFQAVDAEGQRLKDVFWDGEDYAPGVIDTSGTESGGTKDIFDLADCVTYENWKKQ